MSPVPSIHTAELEPVHTVLVPPLLCSARFYGDVIPSAWRAGSVTVADTTHDDSIAGMAQRLLDAAPDRFVLLGTSMGGYVALEVLRQAPERVRGLVLISTSARPDSDEQAAVRARQVQAVESGGFEELVDAVFPVLVAPDHEGDRALLDEWRATAAEVGPAAYVVQQRATVARRDARAVLAGVRCATLVLHGTEDRLISPADAREMADLVPESELELIAGTGHFLLREEPALVADRVALFVRRVASGISPRS